MIQKQAAAIAELHATLAANKNASKLASRKLFQDRKRRAERAAKEEVKAQAALAQAKASAVAAAAKCAAAAAGTAAAGAAEGTGGDPRPCKQQSAGCPRCTNNENIWRPSPLPNPLFARDTHFNRPNGNQRGNYSCGARANNENVASGADADGVLGVDARVTVAVHVSSNRISVLSQLCKHWPGQVVAAVYIADGEEEMVKQWCAADQLCGCSNSYSKVSESPGMPGQEEVATVQRIIITAVYHDQLSAKSAALYPVNTLRNEALKAVTTEYTIGLDVSIITLILTLTLTLT